MRKKHSLKNMSPTIQEELVWFCVIQSQFSITVSASKQTHPIPENKTESLIWRSLAPANFPSRKNKKPATPFYITHISSIQYSCSCGMCGNKENNTNTNSHWVITEPGTLLHTAHAVCHLISHWHWSKVYFGGFHVTKEEIRIRW